MRAFDKAEQGAARRNVACTGVWAGWCALLLVAGIGYGQALPAELKAGADETTWTAARDLDLDAANAVALRTRSNRAVRAELFFQGSNGRYTYALELPVGEQVLFIPKGCFRRRDGASWRRMGRCGLVVSGEQRPAVVEVLELQAILEEQEYFADAQTLYLREPISPVARVGKAWPLHAILDGVRIEGRKPGHAGRALAGFLKKMYGIDVPVNPPGLSTKDGIKNVIVLGAGAATGAGAIARQQLERQGYEGFVVRANDGVVAIAGATNVGTNNGLTRFLMRLGCRFYGWYARPADVIPVKKRPTILTVSFEDRPFFPGVKHGYYAVLAGCPTRGQFRSMPDFDVTDGTAWEDHTAAYLVPKKLYYDEHPEYFAQRGDGRPLPKDTPDVRACICTTHPDVLRISTERMRKWIAAQPDRKLFVITQADDMEWCCCPRCTRMQQEGYNLSDLMLYWVNHVARDVAKEYPDKILLTLAYGVTNPAPNKLKPEPNVDVMYCAWPGAGSNNKVQDFDARANLGTYRKIRAWQKRGPRNIGIYDYNTNGYNLYGMSWKVKWAARHDIQGFWYCGDNQVFKPLFYYVQGRLNWNPFLEVDTLVRDFVGAFYGPAGPTVERILEAIYGRIEERIASGRSKITGGKPPRDFYDLGYVKQVLALFDRASAVLAAERQKHDGTDERKARCAAAAYADVRNTRGLFVSYAISACRLSGHEQVSAADEELFAHLLKVYVEEMWLPEHKKAVAKAREEGAQVPGYGVLATKLWDWARMELRPGRDPDALPAVVRDILDDPIQSVRAHRVTRFDRRIENGWLIPADAFAGGVGPRHYDWRCEGKRAVWVRGTMTDVSRMRARFRIDGAPPRDAGVIEIEGQDSDKAWCPHDPMQLRVNGQTVFEGANAFVKCGWSWMRIPLPAGVLRRGANAIEIRNLANSDSRSAHWIMVHQVRVLCPAPAAASASEASQGTGDR